MAATEPRIYVLVDQTTEQARSPPRGRPCLPFDAMATSPFSHRLPTARTGDQSVPRQESASGPREPSATDKSVLLFRCLLVLDWVPLAMPSPRASIVPSRCPRSSMQLRPEMQADVAVHSCAANPP